MRLERPVAVAQKDADVAAKSVGYDNIRTPIAVDIRDDLRILITIRVKYPSGLKGPIAIAQEHTDSVPVGHHNVGPAIAAHIRDHKTGRKIGIGIRGRRLKRAITVSKENVDSLVV